MVSIHSNLKRSFVHAAHVMNMNNSQPECR